MEGLAGRYTILYGWREWQTVLQFSMGVGEIGVPGIVTGLHFCLGGWNFGRIYNSLWVEEGVVGEYTLLLEWREWRAGVQFCLGGGNGGQGISVGYKILYWWRRDWRAIIQFFLGIGNGGQAMAGDYRILLGWREWRAGIQVCLDKRNGGHVCKFVLMDESGEVSSSI
ncbi:hypothetical protein T03_17923 [Trichinella britovi]|uniref:Uncharacterized protein n=1 Tax=Trichinella britovi TaxID=45882 RepID=A0A0V1D0L2_TRIBR|nr:hypothetical protein T03_17923 [Trichinella britovi]